MRARGHCCVDLGNFSLRIDQVTDTLGIAGFGVVARAVGETERAGGVTYEWKGEVLLLRKGGVFCNGIETRAYNFCV